jgi:APA family basic amino acid/polyamine antiporter
MTDRTTAATAPAVPTTAGGLEQRLGLFDSTMLVAGSMIGSGIFIVSAEIARDTGGAGWLLAVWGLAGLMTVIGALSYGELAAMMPRAGGQYVYLREAYSPLWGFLYGWTSFLVIQTGTIAAVAVAFGKFLGVLVPTLGTGPEAELLRLPGFAGVPLPLPWLAEPITLFKKETFTITAGQLVGVAMILFLTWWNTRGLTEGKWLQNVFTVAKIGGLIAVIAVGLTVTANPEVWRANFAEPWAGIRETGQYAAMLKKVPAGGALVALMVMGGAMVGSLFSADAWNNVTFTAGEVRRPHRNLPLSLFLGTGLVIGLYLLANVAYLTSLPIQGVPKPGPLPAEALNALPPHARGVVEAALKVEITLPEPIVRGIAHADNDRVGTALIELASPRYGAALMAIAIMISTFGCQNGLVLSGARLTFAMARDGLFFRSVGRVNRHHVPAVGLWVQAAWASLLVFSGTYGELLDYVIFAALLFYVLTVAGLFVLRWKRPEAPRPYRAVGYPVLPALYVLLCAAVMFDLLLVKPVFTWPGLILVLTGIPVYFLWKTLRPRVATGGLGNP